MEHLKQNIGKPVQIKDSAVAGLINKTGVITDVFGSLSAGYRYVVKLSEPALSMELFNVPVFTCEVLPEEPEDYELSVYNLMKRWLFLLDEKKRIKDERRDWYERLTKHCECEEKKHASEYFNSPDEYYDGDCSFCTKRRSFYLQIQAAANEQRGIMLKVRNLCKA